MGVLGWGEMEGGLLAKKHLISQFSDGASREASFGEGGGGPQVRPKWGLGGLHGRGKPGAGLWGPHQMVGWPEGGREQGRAPGQLPTADMPTPPTSASP